MISVYDLKSRFQDLLRPICKGLAERGVTANQVTLTALGLSIFYGALLCFNISALWLALPLFLFIRMGLNAIDGMLAREHNMKSKLGMALNELGDVISDTALFIPFIFYAPAAGYAVAAFIFVAALSELCGLLAFMMSGTRRYDGPMGKSDRAAATGILGFIIGLGISLQSTLGIIFIFLTLLCIWSCVNRLSAALKE
tara:strand:- start:2146 stop:2739 length:594 start_codon:yes stop_codon:yes gene_type:complete